MSIIGDWYDENYVQPMTKQIEQQKALLEECLDVLNFIPNQKIAGKDTYTLASEIEKLLNERKS